MDLTSDKKGLVDSKLEYVRPISFDSLVGNENLKEVLSKAIEGSLKRKEVLGHILLSAPPGLGKTTIARIVGGPNVIQLIGPDLDPTSFERFLYMLEGSLKENDPSKRVIFIDEFHSLKRGMKESLSVAMEDFQLMSYRSKIAPFTLIAATTDAGTLHQAVRDRFMYSFQLEFYSPKDLSIIAQRTAQILSIKINASALAEIANRSRGIPRLANRFISILQDWSDNLTKAIVEDILWCKFGIDFLGLNSLDRKVLYEILKGAGKPVGIITIASSLQEDEKNIEGVVEPYLLRIGLIQKTPRGRILTKNGMDFVAKLRSIK